MMTGGKILVLDDEPFVAGFYARALRAEGNDVTVCCCFEDAREHLRRDHPDAVLTDIRVREYNGLHLAMLFRRYSPKGCLVVVTGYDDVVIRRKVDELNGVFFLKPVNIEQLKSAFARYETLPIASTHDHRPPSAAPLSSQS